MAKKKAASEEASFTRQDTPDGAEFTIIPAARFQRVWVAFGILGILYKFGPYLFAATLMFDGLFGYSGPNIATFIVGGVSGFSWWFFANRRKHDLRAPVLLIVKRDGIAVDGKNYSASDIAELMVRIKGDTGRAPINVSAHVEAKASYQVGRSVAAEIKRRNHCLMARLKSSSEPVVLVERLTPYAAEALLSDVSAAMR